MVERRRDGILNGEKVIGCAQGFRSVGSEWIEKVEGGE